MNTIDDRTRATAMLISSVLFRAFFLGAGLMLLTCVAIFFMDEMYAVHSEMFDIPRSEYDALVFSYLGQVKVLVLTIFLVPAIAIRWALGKHQ